MAAPKTVLKLATMLALVHLLFTGALMASLIWIGYETFERDEDTSIVAKSLDVLLSVLLHNGLPAGQPFGLANNPLIKRLVTHA